MNINDNSITCNSSAVRIVNATIEQDLTNTTTWINKDPCTCSQSSNKIVYGTWTADIDYTGQNISHIEFLGRNDVIDYYF